MGGQICPQEPEPGVPARTASSLQTCLGSAGRGTHGKEKRVRALPHQQLKGIGEFNQAATEKKKKIKGKVIDLYELGVKRAMNYSTRQQRWQISRALQWRAVQNYGLGSFSQTGPRASSGP